MRRGLGKLAELGSANKWCFGCVKFDELVQNQYSCIWENKEIMESQYGSVLWGLGKCGEHTTLWWFLEALDGFWHQWRKYLWLLIRFLLSKEICDGQMTRMRLAC